MRAPILAIAGVILASLSLFVVDERRICSGWASRCAYQDAGLYAKLRLLDNAGYFDTPVLTVHSAEPQPLG